MRGIALSQASSERLRHCRCALVLSSLCCALLLSGCATTNSKLPSNKDSRAAQNQSAADATLMAMTLVGTPYRYGGNTPAGGFDCSGLVQYVYRSSAGLTLPRTSVEIGTRGQPISLEQLTAGDLVFYNTDGSPFSHVGIYVGKGRFVHAPSSGGVVRLEEMAKTYWAKRFTQAKRLLTAEIETAP